MIDQLVIECSVYENNEEKWNTRFLDLGVITRFFFFSFGEQEGKFGVEKVGETDSL